MVNKMSGTLDVDRGLSVAKQSLPKPSAYLVEGRWPDGVIKGPPAARYAAEISHRLRDALEAHSGMSIRALARLAGVSHGTVNLLLAGETYPDTKTLAALETALGVPLLPDWIDREKL